MPCTQHPWRDTARVADQARPGQEVCSVDLPEETPARHPGRSLELHHTVLDKPRPCKISNPDFLLSSGMTAGDPTISWGNRGRPLL